MLRKIELKLKVINQVDATVNITSALFTDIFSLYNIDIWIYGYIDIFFSFCRLTSVEPTSFVSLDSLEWLYLQSNQLNTALYETYAPVLNTLQVFDIHGK